GDREIFSKEELIREFRLERVTASPAIFDFEKLYWINRHYIKQIPPLKLGFIGLEYLGRAGLLGSDMQAELAHPRRVEAGWHVAVHIWLARLVGLFAPAVDRLDQLAQRVAFIFRFDAQAAIANPENAGVLSASTTPAVLQAYARRVRQVESGALTPERFKEIIKEVQQETGAKGKDLYHPIRITITGSHSGPEFDKLLPIIEEGSRLQMPVHVLSVRERLEAFLTAFAANK